MSNWIWRRDTGECLSDAIIEAGHSERLPVTYHLAREKEETP